MPAEHPFLVIPGDTLWLRSGRPFLAGEDSADAGLFPPTPWTFQGLIRTHVLHERFGNLRGKSREEIARVVGGPDTLPHGWHIEGPFPAKVDHRGIVEPWFAWPRFLRCSDDHSVRTQEMPASSTAGLLSQGDMTWTGVPRQDAPPVPGWISAGNLAWALLGWGDWDPESAAQGGKHASASLPPFVQAEPRPGIAVERATATAQDHMLYVAVHHRFAPGSGLYGVLRGAELEASFSGGAHMGRRGRTVSLHQAQATQEWERLRLGLHLQLAPVPDPLHLRVVLLTPAIARADGRAPFHLPEGATVRAVDGEVGPDIGGFDRIGFGGRAVRATWAAGSAWWVQVEGDTPQDRLASARALQGLQPHLPDDLERFGFGQRLTAPFDPKTGLPLSTQDNTHG